MRDQDDKCFACGRSFRENSYGRVVFHPVALTIDGQCVFVGHDCHRKICAAGHTGYQPSLGGPRLWTDIYAPKEAFGRSRNNYHQRRVNPMKTLIATVLIVSLAAPVFAVDGDKAAYTGGTFAPYAGIDDVEGPLLTTDPHALTLAPKHRDALVIDYARIIDLEYGQKAGRRVGLAVGLALVNPIGLATLFSKKRRHFFTIGYTDATGAEQVAVLELGKDVVRTTLAIVETRSGKAITYQDDEAKKASRN